MGTPVTGFAIETKLRACPNRVRSFFISPDPVCPAVPRGDFTRTTHQAKVGDWKPDTSPLASLTHPRKATMQEAETKVSSLIVRYASTFSKAKNTMVFGLIKGVSLVGSSS